MAPAGFAQFVELLAEVGDNSGDAVRVAIETRRGQLVASRRAAGRPVYPINPLAVAHSPRTPLSHGAREVRSRRDRRCSTDDVSSRWATW